MHTFFSTYLVGEHALADVPLQVKPLGHAVHVFRTYSDAMHSQSDDIDPDEPNANMLVLLAVDSTHAAPQSVREKEAAP